MSTIGNHPGDKEEIPLPDGERSEDAAKAVDLSQPHDRLFKALLSHPETAAHFFREYLPVEIVEQLTPDLPELVEGSFVPDALSLFISDKLFRVRMVGGASFFIHVLIEHKSYPDRKVGWQVTRGIMASSEQSIREMGAEWERLPAVVPVLIYHGNSPWNYPTDLLSLVEADSFLHPWLLNVRYILVDLSTTADPLLSRHARLRAGFLALKYGTRAPQEQMTAIAQIADALRDAPELLVPVMIYLMATFTLLQEKNVHAIIMQVKPTEDTDMLSIYAQELMAKGEARGEARGERKRAVSMLLRQIQRKFGPPSVQVQEHVEHADLSTIEIWADQILDARTLDDLFGEQKQSMAH